MRKLLLYILAFLPAFGFSQMLNNRTEISWGSLTEPQQFLTFDEAVAGDSLDYFYANFSYDTIGAITFVCDSASSDYAINSSTGMFTIVSTPTYGRDTVKVTVSDDGEGGSSGTYYGLITIKDADSCKFIDPGAVSSGTGTRTSPYKYWTDIVTYIPGFTYLQARNTTTATSDYISLSNIKAPYGWNNFTALGAYGTGVRPIVDASAASQQGGLYLGGYRAEGCQYLQIFSLHFKNGGTGDGAGGGSGGGICVNYTLNHGNIYIWNCATENSTDSWRNAGIYFMEPVFANGDKKDTIQNSGVFNCESFDNPTAHGIKLGRDVRSINNYAHNNSGTGIKIGGLGIARYNYTTANNVGLSLEGDTVLFEFNVVEDNYLAGIETVLDVDAGDTVYNFGRIRNNDIFGNSSCGVDFGFLNNSEFSGNNIYQNGQVSFYWDRYGLMMREAVNSVIKNNYFKDNIDGGIRLRSWVTHSYNDSIYCNIFNESVTKTISFEGGAGGNVWILNNTAYQDSIDMAKGGGDYNVVARNNIAEFVNTDTETTNWETTSDAIFVNAPTNLHLVADDNNGTACGLSTDFDGVTISSPPDRGAYEYQEEESVSENVVIFRKNHIRVYNKQEGSTIYWKNY